MMSRASCCSKGLLKLRLKADVVPMVRATRHMVLDGSSGPRHRAVVCGSVAAAVPNYWESRRWQQSSNGSSCPFSGMGGAAPSAPQATHSTSASSINKIGAACCPMSGSTPEACPESPDDGLSRAGDAALAAKMSAKDIVKQLGKSKLSGFVTSTATVGYFLCGGDSLTVAAAITLGTFMQSLSANTTNQIIEIEHDRSMKRTCKRPLVVGAITPWQAGALAAVELAAGTALLYAMCPMSAYLGVANWVMYVGVYTPLKRRSTTNTWWGAIVGAVPPLMGGTAATNGLICASSWAIQPAYLLGFVLFAWQIPHFMSLAYHCRRDYEAAGFKMLPFHHPTRASVYAMALAAAGGLLTTVGLPYCGFDVVDPWYYVLASIANVTFVYKTIMFHIDPVRYCRSCFVFSYMWLGAILALLCVNHCAPMALIHKQYQRWGLPSKADDDELLAAQELTEKADRSSK